MPTTSLAGSTPSASSASTESAPAPGASRTTSRGRGTSTTAGSSNRSKSHDGSSTHVETRDEEAGRPVDVRERLQELGPRSVAEARPLLAERGVDVEAGSVDDRLALVAIDRAHGVDDLPAGTHPFGRGEQELELELRKRLRAPAQVRPLVEHAEARARRVDECAVETGKLGRKRPAVGVDDANV